MDPPQRYYLQYGDSVLIPLRDSPVTIGRSAGCDLVLNDSLVSRRHASVSSTKEGVVVEDLGSVNGVLVDGRRIPGRWILHGGGWITIGRHHIRIFAGEDAPPAERGALTAARHPYSETEAPVERAPAARNEPDADTEQHDLTRRGNVLALLGAVVDKMLAAGQVQEAAQLFGTRLRAMLADAQRSRQVDLDSLGPAGHYAVKLATATGQAEWVEYVFQLCLIARRPPPVELVDELHNLIRKVPGVRLASLRQLVTTLEARAMDLSASERFALQRLRGLERVAAAR